MAVKTPVKATFTGSDVTGLAEYQAADFIGVADGGSGAVTFTAGILTADGTNAFTTVTAPSGTIVGTSDTQTLTNKTINSASNTITITESNISDLGSYITASSTDTLTNKTLSAPVFSGDVGSNISVAGNVIPDGDDTRDLGTSSLAWANVYTKDLHLNNTTKEVGNEVDGTKGSWVIQEGSSDLYIINRLSGKKYKFKLEEIVYWQDFLTTFQLRMMAN